MKKLSTAIVALFTIFASANVSASPYSVRLAPNIDLDGNTHRTRAVIAPDGPGSQCVRKIILIENSGAREVQLSFLGYGRRMMTPRRPDFGYKRHSWEIVRTLPAKFLDKEGLVLHEDPFVSGDHNFWFDFGENRVVLKTMNLEPCDPNETVETKIKIEYKNFLPVVSIY